MEKTQKEDHKKPKKPERSLRSIASNFFNSELRTAKKLYETAKYDGDKIVSFIEALSKLSNGEKRGLYKKMDGDYEYCIRMLQNCDIIEDEARNVIRIMIESTEPKDVQEIKESIGKGLKELVFEGNGNGRPVATRKFALEMILENRLNEIDVCKGVFRMKNDVELKNHALQMVLDSEISKKEKVEIFEALDSTIPKRYPSDGDIEEKLAEFAKSLDGKPGCIISVLAKLTDTDRVARKILEGRAHEDDAKLAVSVILKRMNAADGLDEYKETSVTLAMLLCDKSMKTRELVAMGLEEHIKDGNEFANRVAKAMVATTDSLLADPDFDTNIDAGEILYSLRFFNKAKKKIRDVAIPDFNDMVNDENRYDEEKRKKALAMLKKLGSI